MTDATTADEIVAFDFDLAEPPSKVWRALTEPDTVSRWITPGRHDAGEGEAVRYDLLDAEPGSRVSYRWREGQNFDGVVTFSISVNAVGGTRLRIVQSELAASFAQNTALACRAHFGARPSRFLAAANSNVTTLRRAA